LSVNGLNEARKAGEVLKSNGYSFDVGFCSMLKRSIRTLWIVLDAMDLMWIPVNNSWKLNERHYGDLQGLNKQETINKYGEEQVRKWRRYVDVCPPELKTEDSRYPGFDKRYKDLSVKELPLTESLKDTQKRVMEYWNDTLIPTMKSGKKVIVSAHGNTIRALVKYLDNIPDNGIIDLNIPTGTPLVYEFDDKFNPIRRCYIGLDGELDKDCVPICNHLD
jgi:phosphoglycerate mutase, BPG-dependent, family 1